MVRSIALSSQHRQHPDPARIAGIAAAVIVNLTLFAVLMVPMTYTPPADPTITPGYVPSVPVKPVPVVPPKPEPPRKVRITPVTPPTVIQPTHLIPVITPNTTPMSTVVTTPGPDTHVIVPIVPTAPVEASLTPIAAPAPVYPIDAARDEVTGTVELELLVDTDGHVLTVSILHSSGDRRLDAAAREQVLRSWRFQPAMQNGIAVRAIGRVPIVFNLDGR